MNRTRRERLAKAISMMVMAKKLVDEVAGEERDSSLRMNGANPRQNAARRNLTDRVILRLEMTSTWIGQTRDHLSKVCEVRARTGGSRVAPTGLLNRDERG